MYEFSPVLIVFYAMVCFLCTYWFWVTSMRIFQLPELCLKGKTYAILAKSLLWLSVISLLCLMIYAMGTPNAEYSDSFYSQAVKVHEAVHSRHFLWYLVPMLVGVPLSLTLINAIPEPVSQSEGANNE